MFRKVRTHSALSLLAVLSFFISFCVFIFVSCNNVLQNSSDDASASATSGPRYAVITGTVGLGGAYPSEIVNRVENDDRSAAPTLPSNIQYYVKATAEGKTPVENEVAANRTYTLGPLEMGVAWTIEAGIRSSNNPETIYMQDIYDEPLVLSEENSTFTHSFVLKAASTTGTGSIDLKFQFPNSVHAMRAVCDELPDLPEVDVSGNEARFAAADIHCGTYEITFFYLSSTESTAFPLFSTTQTVSIFSNMTTSTWVSDGDAGQITTGPDGKKIFEIETADLQRYTNTHIYVGDPGTGITPSDGPQADGGPYSPLLTIGRAIDMIQANGNGADYHIYVTGTKNEAVTIPSEINSKASSIEIAGTGNTRAVINPAEGGITNSVLSVSTTVPITLKNIQLTGGSASYGGGIITHTGSKIILEDGALIGNDVQTLAEAGTSEHGNYASVLGAGIYLENSTLILKKGSKICNNYLDSSSVGRGGAGIVLFGGSLTIENGAAISWNKSRGRGGGIMVPDGDATTLDSVITMKGGEISHNEAANYGAGVFIGHTGENLPAKNFNFSGGTISENNITGTGQSPRRGGAGILFDGGTFTMSGNAVIEKNTAPAAAGGGISITTSGEVAGTFTMTGGIIRNNSASMGGALYFDDTIAGAEKSYSISGSASIPYGVNGTQGNGKNDVYIGNSCSLEIAAALNDTFPDVGITSGNWKRGTPILKLASGVSITEDFVNKLKCAVPSDDWEKIISPAKVTVNCPFYVGSYNGSYGLDTNEGTRTSPYKTIAKACEQMNDASTEYIIKITGTTDAVAQEIPSSLSTTGTYKASAVSIVGVSDASHPPIINRGLCNYVDSGVSDGSALQINSTVPVTITNVKITGGWTTGNGGGINLVNGGNLSLGDGVVITGNRSDSDGGGIYTQTGTVFIYGNAQIGQRPSDKISTAPVANNGLGNCANWASTGGGIYVGKTDSAVGHVYLGYSKNSAGEPEKDEHFTGGIYYNYASGDGGALYVDGTDTAANNTYVQISGGTIDYNCSVGTGGGICNMHGSVELYGGTIEANYAGEGYGAAIAHILGSMAIKGRVSIPYGTGTISASNPLNDIYIAGGGSKISLDSNFDLIDSTKKIKLTPKFPTREAQILEGTTTTNINYFSLNAPGFKLQNANNSGKLALKNIVKTIHVSASGATDPSGNTNADETWNNSTYAYNEYTNNQSKPFTSLTKALQFITYQGSKEDYTIYMTGEFKTSYTIPASDTTDANSPITLSTSTTAKTIKIVGGSALSSGVPQDKINSFVNSSTYKTTIDVTTNVPVTFQKIHIQGGNAISNALTSGGGIKIGSSASVTLGENALVHDNYACCGAGIFNEGKLTVQSGAKIYTNYQSGTYGTLDKGGAGIYNNGSSAKVYLEGGNIYNNNASNNNNKGGGLFNNGGSVFIYGAATFGQSGDSGGNSADYGGAIYNSGYLYLGYKEANYNTGNTPVNSNSYTWSGKIQYNTSSNGSGIYNAASSYVYMKAGEISNNKQQGTDTFTSNGLGVYTAGTFVMNDGTINNHVNNSNLGKGAGVYIANSGTFEMKGGTISENVVRRTGTTNFGTGGAVYSEGTFKMSGAASIPYGATISNTLTKEVRCNDVYLATAGTPSVQKTIAVGNVTKSPAATVTVESSKRGTVYLEADGISDITDYRSNFPLTTTDAWNKEVSSDKQKVMLNAPINVKNSGIANATGLEGNPVKYLSDAVNIIKNTNNSSLSYEIIIDGQVQYDTTNFTSDLNGKAAGITIHGKTGYSTDKIAQTGDTATNGKIALKIATSVPITIKDVTITGGKNNYTAASTSPIYGGGIHIASGANVTLADGAMVTGNSAAKGGGIYNNGTLILTGTGNTEATRANVKGNSAGYGNAADERSGGGIFNDGGTVKLEGYCIVSSNTVDKKGPAIYNKGTLQMKDNATVSDGLYIYSDSYAVELTGKLGANGSAVIDSGNMAEGTTVITKSASLSGTDFESSVKQCSMKNGMYTIQVNAAKTLGTICEGVKVGSTEDLANAIANAGVDGFKITLTGNSNTKIDCSNLGLESESVTHKVHIDLTEYSGTYVPNNDSILYYPKIQEVTLPISNFGAFTFHFADNNTTRVCSDLTTLHIKGGYTDAVDHGMGQANVFINCTKLTDIYYEDIGDNGAVCIGWGMISRYIDQTTNGYINIHLPENTKSIYIVNPQSGDGSVYNSKFNRVRIIYAGSKTKLKQITVTCKNANYNNNEALPCFYSNSTSNPCNWTKGENVATGTWAN